MIVALVIVAAVVLFAVFMFCDLDALRVRMQLEDEVGGGGSVPSIELRGQPTPGRGADGTVAADDYSHLRRLIDEVTR